MTNHYGLSKRFQSLPDDFDIVHSTRVFSQGSGNLHSQRSNSQEITNRKSEWYGHDVS
jgi:hypothetical protein